MSSEKPADFLALTQPVLVECTRLANYIRFLYSNPDEEIQSLGLRSRRSPTEQHLFAEFSAVVANSLVGRSTERPRHEARN